MRVAVVCPYAVDRPGGVQSQAVQLVRWIREEGHEAWLVAPGQSGGPEGTCYLGAAVEVPANGSVVPIALRPGVRRSVSDAIARADVVHIHEPLMPMASLAALTVAAPPKVGTFLSDPAKWASLVSRAARPLPPFLAGRLAAVTAVSPVAAEAVLNLVPEVKIVPCGIDVARYELDEPRTSTRVAFVGRDEPRKGLDVLLEAWPAVRAAVPQAELVVLGAIREPIDGVRFCGQVGDERKRRVLAGASVLVAPNLCGESFGIVLLEGMAAGCAIVASQLSAFSSVLQGAGMLVTPGDSDALASAVVALLGDDQLRRECARRGRQRVSEFRRERVLGDYLDAYRAALAQ